MTNHDPEIDSRDDRAAGTSPESRHYSQLGDELPPEALDRRILAAAAHETQRAPAEPWRVPRLKIFALAAVVVLALSIVLNVMFEGPAYRQENAVQQARQPSKAPPAPVAERSAEPVAADSAAGGDAKAARRKPATRLPRASAFAKPDDGMARDEALKVVTDYLAAQAGRQATGAGAGKARVELERIQRLYDDGESGLALAELAQFREANPDHPVSVALAAREL